MESEKEPAPGVGQRALGFLEGIPAVKSPLRMRYEAETKVFRAQHGGLESIRQKLGFSRRKMCQLLLVDPSAWTRWSKDESKVPPHVYRSLEWFLALNERALTDPGLGRLLLARHESLSPSVGGDDFRKMEAELGRLKAAVQKQKQTVWFLIAALFMLALALVFNLRF